MYTANTASTGYRLYDPIPIRRNPPMHDIPQTNTTHYPQHEHDRITEDITVRIEKSAAEQQTHALTLNNKVMAWTGEQLQKNNGSTEAQVQTVA